MRNALLFALRRLYHIARASFAIAGMVGVITLSYPVVELNLNPPVTAWQIVDAKRVGDRLEWFVLVDKRRDCRSTVKWIGRSGGQVMPLRATWSDGSIADGSQVRIFPGESGKFGPLSAPIPRNWLGADGIGIDADVVYNCGTPWALPAVPVEEAIAR